MVNEPTVGFSIRLVPAVYEAVRRAAAEAGQSMTRWTEDVLRAAATNPKK